MILTDHILVQRCLFRFSVFSFFFQRHINLFIFHFYLNLVFLYLVLLFLHTF